MVAPVQTSLLSFRLMYPFACLVLIGFLSVPFKYRQISFLSSHLTAQHLSTDCAFTASPSHILHTDIVGLIALTAWKHKSHLKMEQSGLASSAGIITGGHTDGGCQELCQGPCQGPLHTLQTS